MHSDRLVLIFIGVWAILFGLFAVTNVRVEWGNTIMGLAAVAAGAACIVRAFRI